MSAVWPFASSGASGLARSFVSIAEFETFRIMPNFQRLLAASRYSRGEHWVCLRKMLAK